MEFLNDDLRYYLNCLLDVQVSIRTALKTILSVMLGVVLIRVLLFGWTIWSNRPQIPNVPDGYTWVLRAVEADPGETSNDIAAWVLRHHPEMGDSYREKDLAYEIEKINEVSHNANLGGLKIGYPVYVKDGDIQ